MYGHNDLDSHTSRYLTEFESGSGYDRKKFFCVEFSVEDLPAVAEIVVQKKTSLHTISISKKVNA